MSNELKEIVHKKYIDYVVSTKFDKVKTFVENAVKERQKNNVVNTRRFEPLRIGLGILTSSLQSNFPGLNFHSSSGMIEDAMTNLSADVSDTPEDILSGKCYIGTEFKKHADFIRCFMENEDLLPAKVHDYFFDYSGEEINDLLHLNQVEFLVCGLTTNKQTDGKSADVRLINQTTVQSSHNYVNNPKPVISTSHQSVLIQTPIGLSTVCPITQLEMYPEIKKDLQTFVLEELLKFGVSKPAFVEAYEKLYQVLKSLQEFYVEIDKQYDYYETIGFLNRSDQVFLSNTTGLQVGGNKSYASLRIEHSDTYICYKDEPDGLHNKKIKFGSVRNGEGEYIGEYEPFTFSSTRSPNNLVEFEMNVMPRIDQVVSIVETYIQSEREKLNKDNTNIQ